MTQVTIFPFKLLFICLLFWYIVFFYLFFFVTYTYVVFLSYIVIASVAVAEGNTIHCHFFSIDLVLYQFFGIFFCLVGGMFHRSLCLGSGVSAKRAITQLFLLRSIPTYWKFCPSFKFHSNKILFALIHNWNVNF